MASTAHRPRLRRAVRPRLEALDDRMLLSGIAPLVTGPVLPEAEVAAANRLLIRFRPGTSPAAESALLAATNTILVTSYPDGPSVVKGGAGFDPTGALETFQTSPLIAYAQPDARITLSETSRSLPTVAPNYPNDASFGSQWGLNAPNDIDIDAPEAWAVTAGNASTIVAVLDSGVDLRNADLVNRLWVNAAASRGRGTIYGWNFVNNNGNVQDGNGHGTHVAGVIAATGNNRSGVVGVDWRARIMPLKILDSAGAGSLSTAVAAVYFAVNHGARVINASWGSDVPDQALADAVRYADQNGVVFVNAAGNDSVNNDLVPTFPGAYRTPNMLVVAAVDSNGNLASFSNYGARSVDIAAPGVSILSTYLTRLGGRATLTGTSMATPFVTGVVSLLVGLHPNWNAEQLVQRILATAKPLASLAGRTVSGGMVDAAQALGVAGSGPDGDHYAGPPAVKKVPARRVVLHTKGRPRTIREPARRKVARKDLGAADVQAHRVAISRWALNDATPAGPLFSRAVLRRFRAS